MELQHNDLGREDMNDILIDEDKEMVELDSEDSEDESRQESSGFTSVQLEDGSVSDTLIGLNESRLRYKVRILNALLHAVTLDVFNSLCNRKCSI